MYVVACHIGVLVLDESMRVVAYELFPRDAETIRERLHVLRKGQMTPELEGVLSRIEGSVVTDLPFELEGLEIERRENSPGVRYVQENLRKIAADVGFASEGELNTLLAEIARLETKTKLRTRKGNDRLVVQAVAAIEDLTEIANLMSERLHEWYGVYYPELERKTKDNERYALQIVTGVQKEAGSVGSYVSAEDLEAVRKHAVATSSLFALKKDFEEYLSRTMAPLAPNITAVAGPILAARLIKHAGSLERLAKMPASTIQLLGAEKALFRFMKMRKQGGHEARKALPPKYGLLFMHPFIQRASAELKGKIARAIAAKISMAAKTDFYLGEDKSRMYVRDLEKKIQGIMK